MLGFVGLAHYFRREGRINRALRAAPRASIRDVADRALCKIEGTVGAAGELLTAPLTGRRCVWYQVTVEERRSRGKSSHWVTVITEERGADSFLVRDDTGKALVRRAGRTEVVVVKDSHEQSGVFDDPDERQTAFLNAHGREGQGWFFNKKLRYREGAIEEGETVAVAGEGRWEPDPAPDPGAAGGYREMPRLLVVTASERAALLVSDDRDALGRKR
jgi:hypothetical protein